ncbi:benenodin family lasso peptide (plasmid) [Novosphingobium sp. BL-8A]
MERNDDVIELGTASIETQGLGGQNPDFGIGDPLVGLAED